ncbi:hypothetical protein AKJ65_03950 [candidate division MSBL1 archaeon SCGC-AAA259E19]|uniref:Uncharacterized protein n=1 Tax=candidate division MSBL1 archaeon SCGC-AAA259E19 TaxID=1698264 RepID=A0A133UK62_9EURY|nr:hypothetical protein AKJ65_03950 [candidate division MSBL1 archaeon SCGC-AAA259E19]
MSGRKFGIATKSSRCPERKCKTRGQQDVPTGQRAIVEAVTNDSSLVKSWCRGVSPDVPVAQGADECERVWDYLKERRRNGAGAGKEGKL